MLAYYELDTVGNVRRLHADPQSRVHGDLGGCATDPKLERLDVRASEDPISVLGGDDKATCIQNIQHVGSLFRSSTSARLPSAPRLYLG